MTAREIITHVDGIKPNAFSESVKLLWLNELEGRVGTEVFLLAPVEVAAMELAAEDTPAVEPPYDDIYRYWLVAKIDEANGEYSNFEVTQTRFRDAWGRFVRFFAGRYEPAQGYDSEEWRARHGTIY